jgi:DNA repair protein RecO (recombination protein O)
MPQGRPIEYVGEAIVLRTWPFLEADLLVSLFTREHGRLKGVARHAMRSRRRFGGTLEPMSHVRAHWTERPRRGAVPEGDLVRLDSFELLSSPLSAPVDYARLAALELVAEVLDELPEGAADDPVFRLTLSVLAALESGPPALPVTYFCLWMNRLMGWMPELHRCIVCGHPFTGPDARGAFYSPTADGLTCADDRRPASLALSDNMVADAQSILREPLAVLTQQSWPPVRIQRLRRFALDILERHLERRVTAARGMVRSELAPQPNSD